MFLSTALNSHFIYTASSVYKRNTGNMFATTLRADEVVVSQVGSPEKMMPNVPAIRHLNLRDLLGMSF